MYAPALGLSAENTYYAYAGVEHEVNRFFSHSIEASHDNQLGFNAANLEGTHVSYSLAWRPKERLSLSPRVSVNFYEESFGSGPASLYREKFTYVIAGFTALYQFGQHWRASLSWDYRLKDSDIKADGYAQNQAALKLIYQFSSSGMKTRDVPSSKHDFRLSKSARRPESQVKTRGCWGLVLGLAVTQAALRLVPGLCLVSLLAGAAGDTALKEVEKLAPPKTASTNGAVELLPEKAIEYQRVCARLASFEKREQELLTQFTGENLLVKEIRAQIAKEERLKLQLEAANPQLALSAASAKASDPSTTMRLVTNLQPDARVALSSSAGAAGNSSPGTNVASVLPGRNMDSLDDKQKLAVGDRVTFRVVEDQEDPKALTVTDAGELDVPELGLVTAAGKTCKQLASEIKSKLEQVTYYHATVIIGIDLLNKTMSGRRVYVAGQVLRAGPQEIPAGETWTVTKAIMRAGGFTDYADKKSVRLVRAGAKGQLGKGFTLNVVEVWEKGHTELDLSVEPEDLIYVPTRAVNF